MSSAALQASPTPTPTATTPMENLCAVVGAGAWLFYWAEKDHNPSVTTYWDALHYIATSLSVGYANIFPVTPMGKTIGAAIMMIGPALSAGALAGGKEAPPPALPDPALLGKLDEILAELKKLNGAREA